MSAQLLVQRKCACGGKAGMDEECAECGAQRLQRQAINGASRGIAPRAVHEVLRSPGRPLDAAARRFMEPRFGHDFSRVRVHADRRAAESASAVNAHAYTVGDNIVFGEGKFAPGTLKGRRLLAHELTHFIQQSGAGPVSGGALRISHPSDAAEREAEGTANTIVESGSGRAQQVTRGSVAVARDEDPVPAVVPPTAAPGSPAAPADTDPQQPAGQAAAAPAAAAPGCSPTALSRPDYVAKAGKTTEFGLTTLVLSQVTYPDVTLAGGVVQPTSAALPNISSIYTGPGVFSEGDTVLVIGGEDRGCPTGKYPIQWLVTKEGAAKIGSGEQEHCDDFQYAFDISLAKYRDAVNKLAGTNQQFKTEEAARKNLEKAVGVHPDNWQSVFDCLAGKTLERDGKRRSWHTPRPRTDGPSFPDCKQARSTVGLSSLPNLGHAPSEIIKGCGETPAKKGGGA
jgi:hypothetical protein